MIAFGAPALVLAYLVYIFFAFDIAGLAARARPENAAVLLSDMYSHKTHVERDNRTGAVEVAIEGERKGTYPADAWPAWVTPAGAGTTVVTLGHGQTVTIAPEDVRFVTVDGETYRIVPAQSGIVLDTPDGEVPDWISASNTRVMITTEGGRLTVTKARTEVFRYFFGWELFFFTLDSPFHGRSFTELVGMAFSDDEVRPGVSNAAAIWSDFWNNSMWRHRDVAWALCETVLMAFLGTISAAIIAVPLAFLSAHNFTPNRPVLFGIRRIFDFLRGVDALIWTIVLSRAFGPGPLTGSLAILLTDTGSFGKLFSEALENVDEKQVEGLRSTGASALQRNRFGVIPQVAPVILSQVLYYLESNTRSATVIGAIVGGGIGLLLTQAIITQKDWEEVTYYIVLIVIVVMLMDTLSGWLRRRLIRG
nr:phosphonate ABC transporter, permease protein PhnE [Frigidibacter oleivorans]